MKASTTARGYGSKHQAARKRWKVEVDAGRAVCSRCRRPIWPGFDPAKVARFTARDQSRLLKNEAIVRNRLKIGAAITNAKRRAKKGVSRRW